MHIIFVLFCLGAKDQTYMVYMLYYLEETFVFCTQEGIIRVLEDLEMKWDFLMF